MRLSFFAAFVGLAVNLASAQPLPPWQITGDAAPDPTRKSPDDTSAALKVAAGAKAIVKLRDADGSGAVSMWVYDDLTKPTDPKARRTGPRWGLLTSSGRVLVIGPIYAPYLGGATTYATSDSDQKSWFDVQYSALDRQEGWHKWAFAFDADKGLSIALDDKKKARFDWNKTKIDGFCGLAIFGDGGKGNEQTIWIGKIAYELGGPVKAKPAPPPPPPDVVPATDPQPQKQVKLVDAVRGKHPRLLFTADEPQRIRKLAQGDGKQFFDQLMRYLPASKPPAETKFLTDATDAQRQGMWRLPTVALHYAITGERKSLDSAQGFLKRFLELPHWEEGEEQDSGMGAANIMVGAAIAYDCLYDQLDPALRDAFRKKLLEQARRMYYRGHLMKAAGTHYWQNDPQNNHRWHRDAGLALCMLAVAEEGLADQWMLEQTLKELQFLHAWLPPDGSSHESSSYLVFGAPYLVLAFDAADRCLGTDLLAHDFFKNTPMFRMHTLLPGLKDAFHYGDSAGTGFINNYNYRCTARHKLGDAQAGLLEFARADADAFMYGWFSLVWFDPSLKGDIRKLPKTGYYPDLGMLTVRDGWDAKNVGFMFKCAPYGGLKLNEYRNSNNYAYVNVAHDDPDANMFILYADGALLADDDRYSTHKVTSSHNTLLVNGEGQKGEGQGWTQPLKGKDQDMTRLARIAAFKDAGNVVMIEGEAGGAYPDLRRFRRTAIWVNGKYILLLDDIRAGKESRFAWLVQGRGVEQVKPLQYRLKNAPAGCDLIFASDRATECQARRIDGRQPRQIDGAASASAFDERADLAAGERPGCVEP